MKKQNILIFPAGTEIAFEIQNALKYSKFVQIYGGTSINDHSEFTYNNLITGFPFIDDQEFLGFLNEMVDKYNIDYIYPAHDEVCVFLSNHSEDIKAKVVVTDSITTNICRSKKETYNYFSEEFFVPKVFDSVEEVDRYPVFVKPAIGQGAKGAKKIDSQEELIAALTYDSTLVITEYLPGMEYTVDCFTDQLGKLRVVKLRNRERIRAGISVRSRELAVDKQVKIIAERINQSLAFKGAWFFQLKKSEESEYRLMEISPRIPGTMGLSRNLGINFPLLTLFVFWGYDVSIIDNGYNIILDRAFYSSYKIEIEYNHIYIDFDDTIICSGNINVDVMRYLYQAINAGKKVHLLSKHIGNIHDELKKYRISEELFEDIQVISADDEKFKYIMERDAIFIDDSFSERKKISEILGIPVFDIDMIESLLNRRI